MSWNGMLRYFRELLSGNSIARQRESRRPSTRRRLSVEILEDRTLPSNGAWLAVFSGITGGTNLNDQAVIAQNLLRSSEIDDQEVSVVEALDLNGNFIVQTPQNMTQAKLAIAL